MLQAQVLCQGPEWGPARRRESSAVVPAPALPSGLMMADNWQQNHDFLHRIEMWGWGWLAAERWDAARRASASPGKAGDSSCAFNLTQCHQEGRVCFSHCLPNFPIPRASSNFFAFSQVQELGNWDFSPKHALLCSAWPTCHCPWGATGVSSPLVLRFHESGFVPDGIVEPWSYLGVPWVFWYRSCACCASAALRALLLCLEHGKAFMLQRGGAVAVRSELRLRALWAQTGPALSAVSERRWILQHIQATYSSPGSFGTREIVWQLVSGQHAMWADGLTVLAAKSLGCSAGRGEREQSSSVLLPKCLSLLMLPWEEQAHGVSGMGTGCFTAEMIPPHSAPGSCYSITEDKGVSEMLSAQAPHWGSWHLPLSCVLQRLTLKATAQQLFFNYLC